MKILKYCGLTILILSASLLSLGIFVPSFEYSSRVTVNAQPEKCWTVLHDTSRLKKWMHGFERLTLKGGSNLQEGAIYEIVLHQNERYVMLETITKIRAPNLIEYSLKNDVMTSEYEFSFIQTNSKTEIINHYRVIGNNLIWKSILILSKSYLESSAHEQLVRLKAEIESGDMEFD